MILRRAGLAKALNMLSIEPSNICNHKVTIREGGTQPECAAY